MEKLKLVEETTLSAEENAARMDEMMAAEEAAQGALAEEMRRLRDIQFKKTQELHNVRTEEKNCIAQIQVRRLGERCGWCFIVSVTGTEAGRKMWLVFYCFCYRYGGWEKDVVGVLLFLLQVRRLGERCGCCFIVSVTGAEAGRKMWLLFYCFCYRCGGWEKDVVVVLLFLLQVRRLGERCGCCFIVSVTGTEAGRKMWLLFYCFCYRYGGWEKDVVVVLLFLLQVRRLGERCGCCFIVSVTGTEAGRKMWLLFYCFCYRYGGWEKDVVVVLLLLLQVRRLGERCGCCFIVSATGTEAGCNF